MPAACPLTIAFYRMSPRSLTLFSVTEESQGESGEELILAQGGIPASNASEVPPEQLQSSIERYLQAVDRALEMASASGTRRKQLEDYIEQLKPRRLAAERQGFRSLVDVIDKELSRTAKAISDLMGGLLPPAKPEELMAQSPIRKSALLTGVYSAPAVPTAGGYGRPQLPPPTVMVAPVAPALPPEIMERRQAEARRRSENLDQERIDFEIWARDCKDRAENLRHMAPSIEPNELRILSEQIAFEGRIKQYSYRDELARPEWGYLTSICEKIFGTLTSIAKYHLNPIGIKIRGIRRDIHADWELMLERSHQEMEELKAHRQRAEAGGHRDSAEANRIAEARREAAVQGLRPRMERDSFELIRAIERGEEHERQLSFVNDVRNYMDAAGVDDWLIRLVAMEPLRSLFTVGGEFRNLRKKLERYAASGEMGGPDDEAADVGGAPMAAEPTTDDEWNALDEAMAADESEPEAGEGAFEGLFAGCRGVMAGGKRKATVEANVKAFFKFDDFEWVETTRGAALDRKLISRIDGGKVEIVFLLSQFLGKANADAIREACKRSQIPCVHLAHGYNKGAVCRGIEEYEEAGMEPPILDREG